MKRLVAAPLFALGIALAAAPADAHRAWMLPSATVLSGEDVWITVDAAVSNDLFYFNHHPLRLDGLTVTGPDGSSIEAENTNVGKYRSTFDVHLKAPGTYRLAIVGDSLFARYKLNGEQKRWRGTAETLNEIPADAEDVHIRHSQRRMETFATVGAPTDVGDPATNRGLELVPVTHPNDLFAGETAHFRLLLDGRPAPGVGVEIVRGGSRYRNDAGATEAKTDAEGNLEITWADPGMYWLHASVEDTGSTIEQAEGRTASYTATLEVLPQ